MATPEWLNIFPKAKVFHLTSSVSNHSPLALRMVPNQRRKKTKKMFRFEAMWLRDQSYEEVVQEVWEEGKLASSGSTWVNCIERCRSHFEAWNKTVFGHVGRRVAELQKRLECLNSNPPLLRSRTTWKEPVVNLTAGLIKRMTYGANDPDSTCSNPGIETQGFPRKSFDKAKENFHWRHFGCKQGMARGRWKGSGDVGSLLWGVVYFMSTNRFFWPTPSSPAKGDFHNEPMVKQRLHKDRGQNGIKVDVPTKSIGTGWYASSLFFLEILEYKWWGGHNNGIEFS